MWRYLLRIKYPFCSKVFSEPTIPIAEFDRLKLLQISFKSQFGLGQYQEALKSCDDYLNISKQYYKDDHPALLSMMNNKAIVYNKIGSFKESLAILELVAQQYTNLFGPDHKSTLISLINLAKSLKMNGEIAQAQKLLEDVITITLSKDEYQLYKEAKINLASCYRQSEKYQEAIDIYENLLQEKDVKPLERANILNDYALLWKVRKEYEKAEQLYFQSLELMETILQENHPFFISTYHNIGELYQSWERREEAQKYFQKALEQIKKRTQI